MFITKSTIITKLSIQSDLSEWQNISAKGIKNSRDGFKPTADSILPAVGFIFQAGAGILPK
jgi:hypothetical protein